MKDFGAKTKKILGKREKVLSTGEILAYVSPFAANAGKYKGLAEENETPLYVFEKERLLSRARAFRSAFESEIPGFLPHFAVKSSNHPLVMAALAETGYGLDVSSGAELSEALKTKAGSIVFTGPGKTLPELRIAAENAGRTRVFADSFGEVERLEQTAKESGKTIEIGIRLTTDPRGLWKKFGIPPSRLGEFIDSAWKTGVLRVNALHFHTSWNMNPSAQVKFIAKLGRTLKKIGKERAGRIEILDIGGGFWPGKGEWLLPWATERGKLLAAAGVESPKSAKPVKIPAEPIETFAKAIGEGLSRHIFPLARPRIFAEPGRWVADEAFSILLRVLDAKGRLVICDGGTNSVGWEKYETDYCPILNLSNPSSRRTKCLVTGSLCTPHDVWGWEVVGGFPSPGDLLLIPAQGAYTVSLRQEFIKPAAEAVPLP